MKALFLSLLLSVSALFLVNCFSDGSPDIPLDPRADEGWAMLPPIPDELPPQARLLADLTIVLDPGHGGDVGTEYEESGYKRGPTGLREAVVNLRTAKKLQELLEEAGANVILTRADDRFVSLTLRADIANQANADLFLSIHFNAGPPDANYSSVWYHGDGDTHPASLDLARELSDSLAWTLRPPQAMSSGIYSDLLMYDDGFGVLREANMPAVLAECSFLSNPTEEQRLRSEEYTERVAWALMLGLTQWASNGVPSWRVESIFADRRPSDRRALIVECLDGMKEGWGKEVARIRVSTIQASINGKPVERTEWRGNRLWLWDDLLFDEKIDRTLSIQFENRTKNSSITPPITVPAGEQWGMSVVAQ
ncbi:N-acetylmuramoyl-L-alanine amidase [bacterium]|nr:N-acetylmuramoyl-L-alanine amidase [bacterium]